LVSKVSGVGGSGGLNVLLIFMNMSNIFRSAFFEKGLMTMRREGGWVAT